MIPKKKHRNWGDCRSKVGRVRFCTIHRASVRLGRLSGSWGDSRPPPSTSLTRAKKYRIYSACILTKFLYGLQTAWLTKLQRRRLDGFHARCIRKLAGIKHSFWSRVSNSEVLGLVDARPLSSYLLEHQLKYFGTLFRKADADIGRKLVSNRRQIISCMRTSEDVAVDRGWHGQ